MTKALIVDDVMENLYMLQSLLTGNGYEVVTAKNGKEALDLARRSTPDLIISDILMPVMDGFTLCHQWRQDPKLREIPFMFYTATYTEPKDEQFALSLGTDAFIVKPIETDAFLNLVQEALTRHGTTERRSMTVDSPGETAYLREYNEVLIRKLEDKLAQLENANKALAIKDFAIESSISAIIIADLSGNLTYANDSFSTMWGFAKSELYGKHLGDLVKDPNALRSINKEFEEKAGWLGEVEAKRRDGSAFIALVAAHSIVDRGDKPIGQLPAGKYVQVAIKDEGVGIPEEVIAKIFDPFFTTKPQGSGLGLATSYAIVKYHGGHIGVSSVPGAGSTFTIWLPSYSGIRTEPRPESTDESLYGDGRILVMDDETVIRHLVERMLRKGGNNPVAVKNGEEALESYRQAASQGESFEAVILDVTIRGGMGGMETASELLKMDPNTAIIMSSGYSSNPVVSKLKEIGCIALIPKPYLMHDLLGTVKTVISQRRQRLGVLDGMGTDDAN
jgi:PAS domain S-box-containing protein